MDEHGRHYIDGLLRLMGRDRINQTAVVIEHNLDLSSLARLFEEWVSEVDVDVLERIEDQGVNEIGGRQGNLEVKLKIQIGERLSVVKVSLALERQQAAQDEDLILVCAERCQAGRLGFNQEAHLEQTLTKRVSRSPWW